MNKKLFTIMNKITINNFTTCEYVGGLGNQLFGIYTALSYSLQFNKTPIFKHMNISPSITHRVTYWDSIFKNLKTYKNENIYWNIPIYENSNSLYNIRDLGNNNVIFKGYFQSYYNFSDQFKNINTLLDIEGQKQTIKEKYKDLFDKKNIGIHFRMGDYKHVDTHPVLPDEYYVNALKNINIQDYNICVFCEKEDGITVQNRMKNILNKIDNPEYPFKIIEAEKDIDEMFLISLCDVIIIANSTFSWWGALFSEHTNVFIPFKWLFCETAKGLIIEGWKVVSF